MLITGSLYALIALGSIYASKKLNEKISEASWKKECKRREIEDEVWKKATTILEKLIIAPKRNNGIEHL